jgi:threonine synthase
MQYISTRGKIEPISFAQAVIMGLATDGGLLLPKTIPQIEKVTLRAWATLNFSSLALEIMTPYVGTDLTRAELAELIQRSYANFTHPEITPVTQVGKHYILELFHGPTAAFKDIALQWLGNLFELLLARSGETLNIIGATSGDTGSAAIYGVRGKERIQIFILHPQGRVSPIQERQMTTVLDANVHNIAIRGTFDDGQRIVKDLFNDLEFKQTYHLGAINSINWARVLAQMVYYFYAWGKVSKGDTSKMVSFAVPTGNFGDIFAGYLAWRMGLPVKKLILATNRNDILTRFIRTGIYQVETVHPTLSPSMDIQIASNFERYLYYLVNENTEVVQDLMQQLAKTGSLQVSALQNMKSQQEFAAITVSEEETLEQIRATYAESTYILDPHTAIGMRAAQKYPGSICLATAHPAKFNEAIQKAISIKATAPSALQGILEQPTRCEVLDANSSVVKQYVQKILA